MKYKKAKFVSCIVFAIAACLFFFILVLPVLSSDSLSKQIESLEDTVFGKSFPYENISERLLKIENSVFGESYMDETVENRIGRLNNYFYGTYSAINSFENKIDDNLENTQSAYENLRAEEIDVSRFIDSLCRLINEKRSFKGLLPLNIDGIANKVAAEQANDLIKKGYLSYFDLMNKPPDERYTLAGGTGALSEIIKGFEVDKAKDKNSDIKLTELLARQLVDALITNTDDSQIIFSPYNTDLGIGVARSKDGTKFVSVIDFVVKGGEFEPLSLNAVIGEKIFVRGKVNKPYKFKAISVAYFEEEPNVEPFDTSKYFDNEEIKPYFPPQDYIAYGDTGKGNFLKVIKGLGAIGAIGAAPFTGGATAVLAPVLISSIQNGPPKEIPLKGGIDANSKGEFNGKIDLNYKGFSGLYFVSVYADLPQAGSPIIISRRTVRVKSPLQPVAEFKNKSKLIKE